MAASLQIEKVNRPELAEHDSSVLDLVFIMDCTGSMGSYISSALENIRSIVEEIVVSEKSDIRLALIEYRDHPPQDHTFATRVHDFTARVGEMKGWLEQCQANGGGDAPEAVADGLHAALKLSWRAESTKICVLIADAPPHGLNPSGDGFPNGCPCGLDPVQIVREMVEKHITLYAVGVEPSLVPYRDFFMSLAYITGGQYVPMINAKLLAKVIIGGVREEISLDRLMQDAQADIVREMRQAEAEGVDEKEKIKRMHNIFTSQNLHSTQMTNTFGAMSAVATDGYSKCTNMREMQNMFSSSTAATSSGFTFGAPTASTSHFSFGGPPPVPSTTSLFGMPTTASTSTLPMPTSAWSGFTFGTPVASGTSSLFGTPTSSSITSPFGTPINASTTGVPASTNASGFTFGTASGPPTTSLFGMPTTNSTSTLPMSTNVSNGFPFGAASSPTTTSLFGTPINASTTSVPSSTTASGFTFGTTSGPPTTSLFGMPTTNSTSTLPMSTNVSNGFTFGPSSTSFPTIPLFETTTNAPASFTSSMVTTEPTYELVENSSVTEDQAARMFQKWQNSKK